jgi:hypothetical protein
MCKDFKFGTDWYLSPQLFTQIEDGTMNGTGDVNEYRYHLFCSKRERWSLFRYLHVQIDLRNMLNVPANV